MLRNVLLTVVESKLKIDITKNFMLSLTENLKQRKSKQQTSLIRDCKIINDKSYSSVRM